MPTDTRRPPGSKGTQGGGTEGVSLRRGGLGQEAAARRLCWAITMHKSQGQTKLKPVIDLAGGVYRVCFRQ